MRHLKAILFLLLCSTLLLHAPLPTEAAPTGTINVDGVTCTLPAAIATANSDINSGGCTGADGDPAINDADTIVISADLFLNGRLTVNSAITIEGNGHTINADLQDRIFDVVDSPQFTVNQLTLTRGAFPIGAGLHIDNSTVVIAQSALIDYLSGGAVYATNGSHVTVRQSTIADSAGDGMFAENSTLIVENSTISGNAGSGIYLAIGGNATVTDSTIVLNDDTGIVVTPDKDFPPTMTLANSIVAGNTGSPREILNEEALTSTGGNVVGSNAGTHGQNFQGFTLVGNDFNASSNRQNVALNAIIEPMLENNSGNTPTHALKSSSPALDLNNDGSDVDQRGVGRPIGSGFDAGAIEGGALVVDGQTCTFVEAVSAANLGNGQPDRCGNGDPFGADVIVLLVDVTPAATAMIESEITIEGQGHTISGEDSVQLFAVGSGSKLTLNYVTVRQSDGSAVSAAPHSVVHVNDSTFWENVAQEGGAIRADSNSTVAINGSTFLYNRAAVGTGRTGGALHIENFATLSAVNSTFFGNEAQVGGAIYSRGNPVTLEHVTVAGNFAYDNAGGIYASGTVTIKNSVISSNQSQFGIHVMDGTINSLGGNVVGLWVFDSAENFGGNVALTAADLDISADSPRPYSGESGLADNGGRTLTVRLHRDHPAIDFVGSCGAISADQRGQSRSDMGCDSGAFELTYADSNKVTRLMAPHETATFGPAWAELTRLAEPTQMLRVTVSKLGVPFDEWTLKYEWEVDIQFSPPLVPFDATICYTDEERAAAGLLEADESQLLIYQEVNGNYHARTTDATSRENCVSTAGLEILDGGRKLVVGVDVPTIPTAAELTAISTKTPHHLALVSAVLSALTLITGWLFVSINGKWSTDNGEW